MRNDVTESVTVKHLMFDEVIADHRIDVIPVVTSSRLGQHQGDVDHVGQGTAFIILAGTTVDPFAGILALREC